MMTIKQLADELGVSKPTISKAMADLSINAEQIGNKFILNETQISQIKLKIMPKTENETATEVKKTQEKLQNSEEIASNQTFLFLQSQLDILAKQLEEKDKQISEKDKQLTEKDRQIAEKDKQLAAKDVQLTNAYSSMENTTAALTAAQALHAGTIQERLTEHSGTSDEDTIASGEFEEAAAQDDKKPSLKQRFKYLFFGE